jgi:SsrA-binding protein
MTREHGIKLVANNRKAYHDYFIEETYEAGLVLVGTEVKSLRDCRVSLRDAFVEFRGREAWLVGSSISHYVQGNIWNHKPERDRKLLLHGHEIDRLRGKVDERGYSVVATKLYFKDGRAKVEIGLAKGKKLYDKRADIAKRDANRELEREMKERMRDRE